MKQLETDVKILMDTAMIPEEIKLTDEQLIQIAIDEKITMQDGKYKL